MACHLAADQVWLIGVASLFARDMTRSGVPWSCSCLSGHWPTLPALAEEDLLHFDVAAHVLLVVLLRWCYKVTK